MTQHSRACYFARRAADLCRYNGLMTPGFSRLPAPRDGAIWQFCHEESGLVILLNASGAVNAKATKAAREEAAAADLARLVASAKEAEAMAREVDSALAALDIESGPVGEDWKSNGPAESFYAQAPALPNGRPGPFAFGPSEEAARAALARLLATAPARAPLPAFCVPLAPTRSASAPLWPVRPARAFAELAAVMGAF